MASDACQLGRGALYCSNKETGFLDRSLPDKVYQKAEKIEVLRGIVYVERPPQNEKGKQND